MKELLKFSSFNFVGNNRKNAISSVAHAVGSCNDREMKASDNGVGSCNIIESNPSMNRLKEIYLIIFLLFGAVNFGFSEVDYYRDVGDCIENRNNSTIEDCDFIITKTSCFENGLVTICVEAINPPPNCINDWFVVSNVGIELASGQGNSTCMTFSQPNDWYFISHDCDPNPPGCTNKEIKKVVCDFDCDLLAFDYTIENCIAAVDFYPPYCEPDVENIVITWGDGSPTEQLSYSSPININHYYQDINGGTYDVCITWSDEGCVIIPGEDEPKTRYTSCCYTVVVPPCDPCDNVTFNWQECPVPIDDKCCIEMSITHPYTAIDYHWVITELGSGDEIYTNTTIDPFLNYNFIGEGPYKICVTLELADGTSFECCFIRSFPPCECCDDADFTIVRHYYSCQKYQYEVDPICDDVGITKHKWIFSDGTEYWGLQPPPHVFTDFVDIFGYVCIIHEIYCGGQLVDRVEKCEESVPGAYLGLLGETRKMSDILYNQNGNPTVYQYLTNMANFGIPVLIEGILEVDVDVDFDGSNGGEWDMGKDAIIYVNKKRFGLVNMIIQDAARVGFPGCCRWRGIQVVAGSELDWLNAHIHDAITMLHLLPSSTTERTFMDIRNCVFEANVTGILWEDHRGTLTNFYGNFFNNPDNCAGTVCGCCYTIAINLNGVSTGVVFPEKNGLAYNNIHGYQHGIKALNTSLFVRNFNIENLKESATVTGGSGIWFIKNSSTYRLLDLNEMHFTNMSYGVKMQINGGGWQRLRAKAQELPGHTTITMDDVYVGYDIEVSGPTKLRNRSYISRNIINTNGGGANFGINIKITNSESNTLQIFDNQINVNGGSVSTMGISLNAYVENSQNIDIVENVINCASLKKGPGIYLNNWKNAVVKDNIITVATFDGKYGIEVNKGSYNTIKCNNVTNGEKGIQLFQSQNNTILGNTFNVQSNTVEVYNDCMGLGSYIARNTFNQSSQRSNWYNTAAITGAQNHEEYNSWDNQNSGNYWEVYHKNKGNSDKCYFKAPMGVARGHVHYPWSNPSDMLDNIGNPATTNDPCNSGGGGGGGSSTLMSPTQSGNAYAGIIGNTAAMDSMNLAPRTAFEQSVYMQISANPTWQTTYPTLGSFYLSATSTYVGQSASVYLQIEALQAQVEAQSVAMTTDLDQLAILTTELDSIEVLMGQTTNAVTLAALEAEIDLLLPQIVVLEQNISILLVVNEGINQASIATISSLITGLSTAQVWEVDEKRVFEILIAMIGGSTPSSIDFVDLRTIAQKCYDDYGRAVFMAQALCLHLLDEYYTLSDCGANGAKQLPSSSWLPQESWTLSIQPNPADDILVINIDGLDDNVIPEVSIFDIMGRAVYPVISALSNSSYSVLTNDLLEGVYLIRVKNGESQKTIKVVIEH